MICRGAGQGNGGSQERNKGLRWWSQTPVAHSMELCDALGFFAEAYDDAS